jgi:putative DNA methylase
LSLAYRKKLIEVALPLEAINVASAREKSIRHGHPSTLHLWWARRPLAACRAVLFAQLVDDPSSHPEEFPTDEAQKKERERLFGIIEQLVQWENSNNEEVVAAARAEILKSCDGKPPPVLDPFCGGGSIPLEAQRLGLEAHGSDLNPVAVLITKALIEIPPRFAGRPPINADAKKKLAHSGSWEGAQGLAEDVRYYGNWMRDEAEKRISHLYPKVKVTKGAADGREDLKGLVGRELTVIAWLWARTAKCPNPACGAQMPLVRSFWLSTKKDRQVWLEPVLNQRAKSVRFEIKTGRGKPQEPAKTGRGASFRCLVCNQAADEEKVRVEFRAKRDGRQLVAIVCEGAGRRVYLPASDEQLQIADNAKPKWKPEERMNQDTPNLVSGRGYGIEYWYELFTARQLVALTTFCDLVSEARNRILEDARAAGLSDDGQGIESGGTGILAYTEAVTTYLGVVVSKATVFHNMFSRWRPGEDKSAPAFGRQALPMVWDFAEVNPFAGAGGDFEGVFDGAVKVISSMPSRPGAFVRQLDAAASLERVQGPIVCTDPPYYDNIGYADLSDFFYVWLRKPLGRIYPDIFSTLLVPKAQELVATAYRFGGDREKARQFFEQGLGRAFDQIRDSQNPNLPMTVFYAFKQAESDETDDDDRAKSSIASTGWETMLEGLLRARFAVTGTWPTRTEGATRMVAMGTNALASSVVLVCRPRLDDAPMATRREFLRALKDELPDALRKLQHGSIAPVDLAQAAIGPGMAVFSRYSKVLETDGSAMTVRAALGLINHALDEVLAEQEGEYDPETRWAVAWFEQFGMSEGKYGDAENLARAKDTAVETMKTAGIVKSGGGKVRLIGRDALNSAWDPTTERRLTIWQVTQYLVHAIEKGGEQTAAEMLRKLGALGESAKDLAYRLYVVAERKRWAQEAFAYNMLVKSWPELTRQASRPSGETARLL